MRIQTDHIAVIIGGAGGIGAAIAVALGRAGCALVLADRDAEALQRVEGQRIIARHAVDIADEDAVRSLAARVDIDHGRADILVNAAGVNVFGSFARQASEDFAWLMKINFDGVVYACRHFLPLLTRRGGHIVNIGSLAGLVGFPTQTSYCASKFAVRGFGAALRAEVRGEGVGVSTILPGAVRTGLMRKARSTHRGSANRMAELMLARGLPPQRLAARVVRAIRRDEAEVVVGIDARLLWGLDARWSGLCRWLLAASFARFGARLEGEPP